MKEILDFIVGNTFLFIGVILFLVATFLVLLKSIVKTMNNKKISIYEEEEKELENVKDKDIIEKPSKKDKIEDLSYEDSPNEELEEKAEVKEESENLENEEKDSEEIDEDNIPEEVIIEDEPDKEELELIEDKEIEERIDNEYKKEIKEEFDTNSNKEIKELLSDISTTKTVNPEEVVKNFEEEQEAQSIISYQELVDVVKNRENEFDDELEDKPLATVSDFVAEKEKSINQDIEMLEMIEQLEKMKDSESKIEDLMKISDDDIELLEPSVEEIEILEPTKDDIEELDNKIEVLQEIPSEGKFKKTDVISPVFGKLKDEEKIDYPKVEKFNRESVSRNEELAKKVMKSVAEKIETLEEPENNIEDEAAEALKSFSSVFENLSEKIEEKDITKEESLEEEELVIKESSISKNEDFLKALKDFRNSL